VRSPRREEKTFESNDEKEELAALRRHFPDHLLAFRDVTEDLKVRPMPL